MQQSRVSGGLSAGLRQTLRAVASGRAKEVWLADDAAEKIRAEVIEACEKHGVALKTVASMDRLGHMCRICVPCAAAALTKDGD